MMIFDPAYSTVEFSVRNLWYTVKGCFRSVEGTINVDPSDIRGSSVTATIGARSIDTGNKQRDAHLRSRDYFDADNFPDIEFKSTRIERGRDRDSLDLDGELTIRGQTKNISLAVSEMDRSRAPNGEEFIYYSATTELDRFDFGIRSARGIVGRKVKVTINVQASGEE
jgi:polyisoprenoid-binding protein YceI